MSEGLKVAVVGATGAVGSEILRLLGDRKFPVREVVPLASERSAGKSVVAVGREWTVQPLGPSCFDGVDVAFFSAGASRSKEYAPVAVEAGALVVDNSSAFRMDPDVPLVVPEINAHAMHPRHRIVAVPNCSAIILLMAVAPLRARGQIRRIIVSTYQSASGAGAAAMEELRAQTEDVLAGRPAQPRVFDQPIAFNLFSHNTPISDDGFNGEERKVIEETRKILSMPDLWVTPTCIRVPVMRAHSESITLEFEGEAPGEDAVRAALNAAPGVVLLDDRENNRFPTPIGASGRDEVFVGRIRRDPFDSRSLSLFACGDQLLKGAALNALQIAEARLSG